MSENKTNSRDVLNIAKKISESESGVKSLGEKVQQLVGSVERIRQAISNKRNEFEVLRTAAARAEEEAKLEREKVAKAEEAAKVPVAEVEPKQPEKVVETKTIVDKAPVTHVVEKPKEQPKPFVKPVQQQKSFENRNEKFGNNNNNTANQTSERFGKDDFKKKGNVQQDKKKSVDDRHKLNKKAKIQKGYETGSASVEYDEISGEIMKIRARRSNDKKKQNNQPAVVMAAIDHAVLTSDTVTIKQLSEKIGKSVSEILKKLFMELGIIKTINDNIDFDTAELVAAEFGITLELQQEQTSEEKLFAIHADDKEEDEGNLMVRPPIVTIMGHVDHGKTSILDYIRKAHVASGEAGGITQHIGAYTIRVPYEGQDKSITFLDTPGHEAFTAMRARGADITDIVVIVVAADDGIMPQTIEAINHAKAAKVPIIVAINKMDKPEANPDRVLQQLSEHGILVEDWMGDVPAIRVSAKTGMGINDLLYNILATAEISELKANPNRSAKGAIVEAKLDKGKGPVATVLVQNGTLHTGDFIVAGTAIGRVRAMFDDKGKSVSSAAPSTPVSILGLQDVPNAGDQIMVVKDEKLSKQVVEERKNREKIEKLKTHKVTLEEVFSKIEEGKFKDLNLILKADVQGSVEAVKQSLLKLSNDEVKVHIVHSGVGAINESDVTLADTTNAIIIGFNIRPDTNAKNLAEKSGVDIKLYRVIYDAINDISLAIKGMLAPTYKETYLGRAEVRQIFKISSVGTIAGCMVKDGKITRNANVRLLRDGVVIVETTIASLKRMKDDVKEVNTGFDCGVGLNKYNDIRENDVIEAYIMEEVR